MKIDVRQRDHVRKISTDYKDTFEEFNSDVDFLLNMSITTLATAKKKQSDAKNIVNELESRRSSIADDLIAKEREIQNLAIGKERRKQEYIAEKRQEFINKADVHSKDELNELQSRIAACDENAKNAVSSVSIEDLISKYQMEHEKDGERTKALDAIVKDLGHSYGLFPSQEKFTKEFSKIYKDVRGRYNSQDGMRSAGVTELKSDAILQDYADNYKVNPYKILKILYAVFLLPVLLLNKLCNNNVVSLIGALGYTKGTFIAGSVRDKAICIFSYLAWLLELYVLLGSSATRIILVILAVAIIGGFFFAKSQMQPYVEMLIRSDLYYNGFSNDSKDKAQSEFDAQTRNLRNRYAKRAEESRKQYDNFIAENNEAREKASKSFKESSVSVSDIEADYKRQVEMANADRDRIKKNLESADVKLSNAKTRLNESLNLLQKAREKVKSMFEEGIEIPSTNGFNNSDINVTEPRKFIYHYAYFNAYSMINGLYVCNAAGMPIDGLNLSNIAGISGFNDIPLRTIPVSMSRIDIIELCKNCGVDMEIANILVSIVRSAGEEIISSLRELNAKPGLDDFYADDKLDRFDTLSMYKIITARHDNKCTVVFYDSKKDLDYEKTISRFIYERLFKSNFLATNPSSARYHFVVKDRTYFDNGNILTLTRQSGAANENKDAALKKMESDGIYDIVDKSGYQELLKVIRSKRMPEFRDAVADMSSRSSSPILTNTEYLLTAKAKGSTPQTLDYIYVWLDPRDVWCEDMRTILQSTGGSKVDGSETSTSNVYGVVPFIFIDQSTISNPKRTEDELRDMQNIVNCISVNNFFAITEGAKTLYSRDVRQKIIVSIKESINALRNR